MPIPSFNPSHSVHSLLPTFVLSICVITIFSYSDSLFFASFLPYISIYFFYSSIHSILFILFFYQFLYNSVFSHISISFFHSFPSSIHPSTIHSIMPILSFYPFQSVRSTPLSILISVWQTPVCFLSILSNPFHSVHPPLSIRTSVRKIASPFYRWTENHLRRRAKEGSDDREQQEIYRDDVRERGTEGSDKEAEGDGWWQTETTRKV